VWFSEKTWNIPERYVPQRYLSPVHGVGLVDEYPVVPYPQGFAAWGSDGVFVKNMVVSVESYIGEGGGLDGVKLEEQVLITDDGAVPMSGFRLYDAIEGGC
jgi:Xaa-Pro aminopeptidase